MKVSILSQQHDMLAREKVERGEKPYEGAETESQSTGREMEAAKFSPPYPSNPSPLPYRVYVYPPSSAVL